MQGRVAFLIAVTASLLIMASAYDAHLARSSTGSSADAESCQSKKRSGAYFLHLPPMAATPKPPGSLIQKYISSGIPAAQHEVEQIMQTLRQVVICQNAGDFSAVAGLFTDGYWQTEIGALPAKAREFAAFADATPSPPAEQMEQSSSFGDARLLPDGRIAGFLRWNGRTIEDSQLVAFRQIDGHWLIDEVSFVTDWEVLVAPHKSGE